MGILCLECSIQYPFCFIISFQDSPLSVRQDKNLHFIIKVPQNKQSVASGWTFFYA